MKAAVYEKFNFELKRLYHEHPTRYRITWFRNMNICNSTIIVFWGIIRRSVFLLKTQRLVDWILSPI
jgi:hypothetical protein